MKLKSTNAAAAGLAILSVSAGLAVRATAAPPPPPPSTAFERNPAPGERTPEVTPVAPPTPSQSQDDTPLGANLASVVLIGASDKPESFTGAHGVDVGRITTLPRPRRLGRRLDRFLGQPLSQKLISEIQTAVVLHYRRAGHPFVSVIAPPQDVTDGVLRLRVVEFHLGKETTVGQTVTPGDYIRANIRAKPGELIDGARLDEDLTWLNHSPFRTVTAVFSPGEGLGASDIRLETKDEKPWTVFAGYANSGSPSTSRDRFILGGQVGDLLIRDSLLSVELTSSNDYWTGQGAKYADAAHPRYLSDSLVFAAPIAPRQDLTLAGSYVESVIAIKNAPFSVRSRTEEASLTYRTAVSNFLPFVAGDVSMGVEALGQQRNTLFFDIPVFHSSVDVGKVFVGWADTWNGLGSRQSLALGVHVSPGNLGDRNRDLDYAIFTNGRVAKANYVYGTVDYSTEWRFKNGWRYVSTVHAQATDSPLLDTEQMALGGDSGIRGYTLDSGAFDEGVIWRNELRTRASSLFGNFSKRLPDVVSTYGFIDLGLLRNMDHGAHQNASTAGFGADYAFGHLTGGLTGAWALEPTRLSNVVVTREGHFQLFAHARVSF